MNASQLLTIAEIAKILGIPESTARFYRNRFEMFIPSVGSGRNKRYRPEAVDVIRYIAEAYKRNEPQWQIEEALSRMVPINAELPEQTATTTAVAQQQGQWIAAQEQMAAFMGQVASALETIAAQKAEIAELRKHIADLESRQEEYKEAAERRFKQTDELLRELREARSRKKKWWPFRQ